MSDQREPIDDYVEQREVIEFSDVLKVVSDFNRIVNDINSRFMWMTVIALACITIIVSSLAGFYFMTDYQYPVIDQQSVQTENSQTVNQNIK